MYSVSENEANILNLPKRQVKVFVGGKAYKSQNFTMGKTIVDPKTSMDPHTHEIEEEIIFVTKGTGYAIVGGSEEPLKPNTAVVFPVGVEHVVHNTGDETMEFVFMFNPCYGFNGMLD